MEWENVHVFISSTFNDMHAERDFLVRRVFPPLRAWCAERHLKLLDIDLRWGISREDAEENKRVVDVCLHNVDRCRPFFLGFLGQRRGWVPGKDDVSPETLSNYPELSRYIGDTSVTELEILHALLHPFGKNGVPVKQARIYTRDDRYLREIRDPEIRQLFSPEKRGLFARNPADRFRKTLAQTVPLHPYLADWDPGASSPELSSLNGRDLSAGRLVNFRLPDGTTLEHDIQEWLKSAILEEFPEHAKFEVPSEGLPAELYAHDTLRDLSRDGYLPRPGAEAAIRDYFAGSDPRPMILYAEAGAGKTSLVSHILSEQTDSRPLYRFAGTTFESSGTRRLLSSLLEEMKEQGLLQEKDLSVPPDLLVQMFPFLLERAASRAKKLHLVIDALDQLEDPELVNVWLGRSLPRNVRILITVKEDSEVFSLLPEDAWPLRYRLGLLEDPAEIRRIISETLMQYLKQLDEAQTEQVLTMKGIHNPLFLHIVLMELRQHGSFETLSRKLAEDYGETPREAFAQVLLRLCFGAKELIPQGDFTANLVFRLLALAREALPVSFLANLLRISALAGDRSVFRTNEEAEEYCHVLFRQAGPYLTNSGGRVSFRYDSMRRAAASLTGGYEDSRYCNLLAMQYFYDAEEKKEAAAMRSSLYFLMRGERDYAEKLLSSSRYLLPMISLIGSSGSAVIMREAGSDTIDTRALEAVLLQGARRLDVCPDTLYMELRSLGDGDDPLIRAILENAPTDGRMYFTETGSFGSSDRILMQRDFSGYVRLFPTKGGILAVGYKYMTMFSEDTLIPVRTVPCQGGMWARVCGEESLYLISKKTRKEGNDFATAGYDYDQYSLGDLSRTASRTLSGGAVERDYTFHAAEGQLFGMAADTTDGRKSWNIMVCNFTKKAVILKTTVSVPEISSPRLSEDERRFYNFLLQQPPRPYFTGSLLLYQDPQSGMLRFFDLMEEKEIYQLEVPRLGNLFVASLGDAVFVLSCSDRKYIIRRLVRQDASMECTASAEIPFSADSLVSSGKYIFAVKENRFCRLDAETLSDMRMFSSDATDDLQKCAQGLALARPDGRILLGVGNSVFVTEKTAWRKAGKEEGAGGSAPAGYREEASDNLSFESYKALIHGEHVYHLGRQILDIDLADYSRRIWRRKYSPMEVFDTVNRAGDLILAFSKIACTVSVLNLKEHRQLLYQRVCDPADKTLQCACLMPGATEEDLSLILVFSRKGSAAKRPIDLSDQTPEADFYSLQICRASLKGDKLDFRDSLDLPGLCYATVLRTVDVECVLITHGDRVYLGVAGAYENKTNMINYIYEVTTKQVLYHLREPWRSRGMHRFILIAKGHIFLPVIKYRQDEKGTAENYYLLDVDLGTVDPGAGKDKPSYRSAPMDNTLHHRASPMVGEENLFYMYHNIISRYRPDLGRFVPFLDLREKAGPKMPGSLIRLGDFIIAGENGNMIWVYRKDGEAAFRQRLTCETTDLYADEERGLLITVGKGDHIGIWKAPFRP